MTVQVEEQIRSCKQLLKLFREEREDYASRQTVAIDDVLESMKKKQKMVEVFSTGERLVSEPPKDEAGRKLLRELGDLLEQLLVIEQENELTLSRLIKSSQTQEASPSLEKTAQDTIRPRPALQQRLPFVPRPASPPPSPAPASPAKPPRSAAAARQSSLKRSSKYI